MIEVFGKYNTSLLLLLKFISKQTTTNKIN
jgi:hypothetical protein